MKGLLWGAREGVDGYITISPIVGRGGRGVEEDGW